MKFPSGHDHRETAMEIAAVGLFSYDLDGRVRAMDPGCLKILELDDHFPDSTAVVGKRLDDLFNYDLPRGSLRSRVLENGYIHNEEYRLVSLKGNIRWALHSAWLVEDSATGQRYIEVLARDITEIKRRQEELEKRNEELSEANRRLEQMSLLSRRLLANVTHELRSPLASIRFHAEAIASERAGSVSPRQGEFLSTIIRTVDRLALLVVDLMDYAHVEAGGLKLARERLNLAEVVRETLDHHEILLAEQQISICRSLDGGNLVVEADRARLVQILINLLDNAAKFGGSGKTITVAVDGNGDGLARLRVGDEGPGIAPENIERVFEIFFQEEKNGKTRRKGIGLGLALARSLARQHGGDLTLTSEPGKGTEVTLTLPLAASEEEKL
jgi:PAS domain S-box-containing protein